MSLKEASPSLVKVAPKKLATLLRFAKKKVVKMSESESLSSIDDEDARTTPRVELASGVLSSNQKKLRRVMSITSPSLTSRPPINAKTGRRTLEIREPHKLHVQNLKEKLKINPHSIVVPFIVMVDPIECAFVEEFDVRKHDQYNYFVISGSHLAKPQRQLVREHPTTFFFKYAEGKIYMDLTTKEANLLAWDRNNDKDYRQKMSSIE